MSLKTFEELAVRGHLVQAQRAPIVVKVDLFVKVQVLWVVSVLKIADFCRITDDVTRQP